MSLILSIIIWFLIGAGTAYLAQQRGRDPYIWFALGMLLGLFGILILLILPRGDQVDKVEDADLPIVTYTPSLPPKISQEATKDWFYIDKAGQQFGPLDVEAMQGFWLSGAVDEKTFIWSEGMDKWKRAEEVPEFKELMKIKYDSND